MRRAVAFLVALSALSVTAGDAAKLKVPGRIVFASERGSTLDNSELYSIRVNGSARRALTRNQNGADQGATWSPDGTRIAFWSERPGGGLFPGLYVMRADGGKQRRLTPRGLAVARDFDAPSWAPDGTAIAFSGDRGSRRGIWTIRPDGTRLRFLAQSGIGPVWSPQGDRIAFAGANGISVVAAAGGRARRLTRGLNDGLPAWAPDGRSIAFVRSNDSGSVQALDVVPAGGGRLRRIFSGEIGRDLQWSRSGLLLFEANNSIYVARVRDRAVTRLRRRGDWPAFSPDGRRVAFTGGSSLFVMNANGSGVRRVRAESGREFNQGPVWSPDGKTLVYSTSLTKSDFEIFVARADGSSLRQLTHNSVNDWMPAWSPARRKIAFVRGSSIWLMAADGTGQRKLFTGAQPSWSPTDSQLAFTEAGAVKIRSLSGGPATTVAQGFSPAWSPTGEEIAFVREKRIMAVDLSTKVERTILDLTTGCSGEVFDSSIQGPDWAPDGRQLVFALTCDDGRFASTGAGVVRADGSGLRGLPLDDLAPAGLAWSPDGARVAFVTENEGRPLQTVKLDGTGRTTAVKDSGGVAYLDPDW
jgi:Tol biopolymer transport system component